MQKSQFPKLLTREAHILAERIQLANTKATIALKAMAPLAMKDPKDSIAP